MLHHRRERQMDGQHPLKMFTFLLIAAVGLVGKQVCPADAAIPYRATFETLANSDSPAQRYFDAVAPEDRENFIKYHLDKALEQRVPGYRSGTPKDFDLPTFQPTDLGMQQLYVEQGNYTASTTSTTIRSPHIATDTFIKYSIVCYRSGCIDTSDIGHICCPF